MEIVWSLGPGCRVLSAACQQTTHHSKAVPVAKQFAGHGFHGVSTWIQGCGAHSLPQKVGSLTPHRPQLTPCYLNFLAVHGLLLSTSASHSCLSPIHCNKVSLGFLTWVSCFQVQSSSISNNRPLALKMAPGCSTTRENSTTLACHTGGVLVMLNPHTGS